MANKNKSGKKYSVAETKKHSGNPKSGARKRKASRETLYALIAITLIAAIAIGCLYFFAPDAFNKLFGIGGGNLPSDVLDGDIVEINFMDVGQGDCIIIRFHDGKNMIIDSGSGKSSDSAFKEILKPSIDNMGIEVFDYMILTHTDEDHVSFLDEIFYYYQVNTVYRPAFRSKSESENNSADEFIKDCTVVTTNVYDKFVTAAESEPDCEIKYNVGNSVIAGDGYKMDIYGVGKDKYKKMNLQAEDLNAVSPICDLQYSGRSVIFTGDAEGKSGSKGNGAENDFIERHPEPLDCDVLKVGHHGSESSATDAFLKHIDPEYAIISVGAGNSHKHPRPECISRLEAYRDAVPDSDYNGIADIFRTDIHGRIRLKIAANGGMKFETEKTAA